MQQPYKEEIETIQLYVTPTSFVLVDKSNVLEIDFEKHTMIRKESFEVKDIVQKYEIYGVLGLFEGFREKYMVVISSVQLRGHIMGHAVYSIQAVTCLSFNSYCQKLNNEVEEEEEEEIETPPQRPVQLTKSNSFLTRIKKTFSSSTSRKKEPMILDEDTLIDEPEVLINKKAQELMVPTTSVSSTSSTTSSLTDQHEEEEEADEALEQRLVKQVTEMFSKSMFLFSRTWDITHSFQQSNKNKQKDLPLWKQVDKRFWWNEHFARDFITNKLDEWIIPVMQGTLQIEPSQMEGYSFDFILISRRSRERAGMRYQRRGINEDGQVANFVETEQIIIFKKDEISHVASFIQTRGSIPLFWSQSPYSLHPIPTLERTEDENEVAFEKHFQTQEKLYGKQIVVNLAELTGREAIVGSQYRKHVEHYADPNIKYVEFDFHKETKGMKFENIHKLSKSLYEDLSKMQYFWEAIHTEDGETNVYCTQAGVFRTNCMDCLDRTNVVQSAFGRSVLNLQLMRLGISEYPEQGIKYYNDFERIFNNVWANNGDMISKMYAGTSALKGDFTRTGKRNITGMMNDASNSLTRMYFNTTKDFWKQATIDFVLGYHKTEIFRHVPQSTKMSAEPGLERRWAKIRSNAINTSSEIVIGDEEKKIDGWTLLSPTTTDLKKQRSSKSAFEEKVVLLTEKALYVCSFNYDLEKVIQFKRLDLKTILSIQMGEYILSTSSPASRSEDQNYGVIINHSKDGELVRWNTGSIRNQSLHDLSIDQQENLLKEDIDRKEEIDLVKEAVKESMEGTDSIYFKAVRYNVLGELDGQVETCKEQIQKMVAAIAKAAGQDNPEFIQRKPIISLEQAEKTDNVFAKMGQKLKMAMWV